MSDQAKDSLFPSGNEANQDNGSGSRRASAFSNNCSVSNSRRPSNSSVLFATREQNMEGGDPTLSVFELSSENINLFKDDQMSHNDYMELVSEPPKFPTQSQGKGIDMVSLSLPICDSNHPDQYGCLMPDIVTFSLVLFSGFLVNANYFVIFPTVREYCNSLHADETFFGWVLSIQNLIQLFLLFPIDYASRFSFKYTYMALTFTGVFGNVLYALGSFLESKWALLGGSALIGVSCSVWICYRKFVAETTGSDERTKAFTYLMLAICTGYCAGPLLGVALSFVHFNISSIEFNGYTTPGWFMAVTWGVFALLISILFKEPSRVSDSDGDENCVSASPLGDAPATNIGNKATDLLDTISYRLAVAACGLFPVLAQFLMGVLETTVTVVGPNSFDWSVTTVGVFLSGIASLCLPVSFITSRLSASVMDRTIIICSLTILLVGVFLLTEWPSLPFTMYQFCVGATLIFVGQGLLDSIAYSLASKMVPSYTEGRFSKKNLLFILNLGLCIGRPLGPLWGAESTVPAVGMFGVGLLIISLTVIAFVLALISYERLQRWQQQPEVVTCTRQYVQKNVCGI
eukprot:Nk52_evm15s241 gene=Nk52_evmTU15s241